MPKEFRYKAFNRYSHADRKSARWIQRKLEQYRLPPAIAANYSLPRRALYPIFRDDDELAVAADLSGEIKEALKESENLIVVCSPNAVASYWVGQEIATFQSLGRGNKIFTLIVAGDPNSQNDQCFPAQLLELSATDPLAAMVWTPPHLTGIDVPD